REEGRSGEKEQVGFVGSNYKGNTGKHQQKRDQNDRFRHTSRKTASRRPHDIKEGASQEIGAPRNLRDADFGAQIDVLNSVEEPDAFAHRTLERLAAGNKASTAGALVDHCGGDGFFEVVRTRCTAGVDQAGAAHVTVRDL